MNTSSVVVQGDASGFLQHVQAGSHELRSDEPESVGGANLGPTPYDLLLAALGSCTSMTIAMYARRKSIPLEHVTVNLVHGRVHSSDCEGCENQSKLIDQIERRIQLRGKLSEEQIKKLLIIANRCPVHRTLTGEIKIVTTLYDP